MTMAIRQMTQEELDELFGSGVVLFGMKPQPSLKQNSENQEKEKQSQAVPPSTSSTNE